MGNGSSQSHRVISSEYLGRNMHLSPVSPEYFCPANKEFPYFLILLLSCFSSQLRLPSRTAACPKSDMHCHVQFWLPHKFQISKPCVGVLASCCDFNSWSVFPLFPCCLSLNSLETFSPMPPRIPDVARSHSTGQLFLRHF